MNARRGDIIKVVLISSMNSMSSIVVQELSPEKMKSRNEWCPQS